MHRIGERIKKRRESLNIQTNDLASTIGMTPSLISQIEKSKSFPSLITLIKIADALTTTVGELIGENEASVRNPLVKADERKIFKHNDKGTSSYLLSNYDLNKQMEPYIIHFKKKSDSTDIMTSNYPSQEFCFVVDGSFEVHVNKKKYILNKGDSFYFNSNQLHTFINISENDAQLLWVVKLN